VPGDLVVEHYAQRAGVGLIVSEGTYPDPEGQAFVGQPGIVTDEQVAGWRRVADAVHARGGRIVLQVMHGGRVTHPDVNGGRRVVAPSAIAIQGEGHTEKGKQPYPVPHALTGEEARQALQDFVAAAERAVEAGLDGVEIHGANGYLLDQFLTDYLNRRTDEYGGSPGNRVRFPAEVCRAVREAVGPEMTVGIRISQAKVSDHHHKWAGGADEAATIFSTLGSTGIDFIHTTEYKAYAPAFGDQGPSLAALAKQHSGLPVITNGHLDDPETAVSMLVDGADVVALGKAALATRDWPNRVRNGLPLDEIDARLFEPVADVKDWELELS
jgi:2,4-dienoyl-CoA reductase-like NADH-dependent reductase (Old Yellow Enzyme family)